MAFIGSCMPIALSDVAAAAAVAPGIAAGCAMTVASSDGIAALWSSCARNPSKQTVQSIGRRHPGAQGVPWYPFRIAAITLSQDDLVNVGKHFSGSLVHVDYSDPAAGFCQCSLRVS